jgi:hypothetical protein
MIKMHAITPNELSLHQRLKFELKNLCRKEEMSKWEPILEQTESYTELIRQVWYGIFTSSISSEERRKHYDCIRNVFEIYTSKSALRSITSCSEPNCEFNPANVEKMLSQIPDGKHLLMVPMTGGMLPAAFVHDYLESKSMLIDTAFVGHTRGLRKTPAFYTPNVLHISKWDRAVLEANLNQSILMVDLTVRTGATFNVVSGFLQGLGMENVANRLHHVYLLDLRGEPKSY